MLDLRLVETLRVVGDHGSFSAAARALQFTQPAVSRQIALLERSVGLPLVVRSRQGAYLTAAGRLVVDHADAVRARLLRLDVELAQLAGGSLSSVTLGAFPTAFVGLVPAIVQELRAHGVSQIALRRCGHDEAIALVRRAEVDVAIVFARSAAAADPADVRVVDLVEEPMVALLPRAHPLAGAAEVDLGDLRDEPWIAGARDPASSIILAASRQAGFEPRVAFESDDTIAIQSLVAAGLGVSLTTPWLRVALRDDVVLRPVAAPAPVRRIQAVLGDPSAPGADMLLDAARAAAVTL
jgi:DNA-binding transcriptional LysR family regulator